MKLFLLVSDRRSGTNNLGYMLGQYPEVLSAGEIFHPATSYGGFAYFEAFLGHLEARIGLEPGLAQDARDRAVSAWTHANPIEAVETLLDFAALNGKTCTIFKVFPGHLRAWQLDRIVGRFRPEVLLLLRTPLEAYVSLQKANALRTWVLADTTGMRVRLDAADFAAWHARTSGFYRFAIFAALARGLQPRIVHYDALYKARAAPQEVVETVFRQMGVPLQAEAVQNLKVQDRGGSVLDSIENFDAFEAALGRAGKAHAVYQFDLFGRLAHLEYLAKARLGPLRRRAPPAAAEAEDEGEQAEPADRTRSRRRG
jgi:hypothetical protein